MITSPPYARVWYRPPVRLYEYTGAVPALIVISTEGDPACCRIGLLGRCGEGHYVETLAERVDLAPRVALQTVDCRELWTDNLDPLPEPPA